MKSFLKACGMILLGLGIGLSGCKKDDDHKIVTPVPVYSLQIDIADTLNMPLDTSYYAGIVVARDDAGRMIDGIEIELSLTLNKGWFEYVNADVVHSTDAFGRLTFVYSAAGEGVDTIVARHGGQIVKQAVHLIPVRDNVGNLTVAVSTDTLGLSHSGNDSVIVAILVRDSLNNPRNNVLPFVWASNGDLSAAAPSGSSGVVSMLWYPNVSGLHHISAITAGKRSNAVLVVQ
jgi:hypothetical protein